jgi:hypothetical protein
LIANFKTFCKITFQKKKKSQKKPHKLPLSPKKKSKTMGPLCQNQSPSQKHPSKIAQRLPSNSKTAPPPIFTKMAQFQTKAQN